MIRIGFGVIPLTFEKKFDQLIPISLIIGNLMNVEDERQHVGVEIIVFNVELSVYAERAGK